MSAAANYSCPTCGAELEPFGADSEFQCPDCGEIIREVAA